VKVKLSTVRKAWINNDIRKRCLIGLNKYIDITTPISSSTLINKVTTKPVSNSLHNHGMIPNILNKKFNDCNNSPIRIKVPINKIKFGDVGYKFEKYFKNHGVFEGQVMEILMGKNNKLIRRCWYNADDDWEDLSLCQLRKLKRLTPIFLSPIKDKIHTLKKLKEFKLPSVNNIKIGDIGFRFKKDFIGYGIFEG